MAPGPGPLWNHKGRQQRLGYSSLELLTGFFHERLGLMGGLGRMAAGGRQTCHGTVQCHGPPDAHKHAYGSCRALRWTR